MTTLPSPDAFTLDDLKRLNATSWQGLALLAAGLGPRAKLGDSTGSHATRVRAAALIERAVEMYRAEADDEARSRLMAQGPEGRDALRLVNEGSRGSLSDFVDANRMGLAIVEAGLAEMLEGRIADLGRELTAEDPSAGDYLRALVLAWDAAARFKAEPAWVPTDEEWGAMRRGEKVS